MFLTDTELFCEPLAKLNFINLEHVRAVKISRNGNRVGHIIGQLGRREVNGCLRHALPPCVLEVGTDSH